MNSQNIVRSLNKVKPFLKTQSSESETLKAGLYFLAFLIFMSFVDFLALYLNKFNYTLINPFLQALPFYLLLGAPVFLLGRFTKIYITLITLIVSVVTIAEVYVAFTFKIGLDGSIFNVIAVSSVQEIKEFVVSFFSSYYILYILLAIAVFTLFFRYFFKKKYTTNKYLAALSIALALPFVITFVRYCIIDVYTKSLTRNSITNIIVGYIQNYEIGKQLENVLANPKVPADVKNLLGSDQNMFGVIVIGESASRNHMGLYGYPRQNTPLFSSMKNELFAFDNVVSAYAATALAIKYDFTFANLKSPEDPKCSFVDILKAAGYKVYFISNQYRWGHSDGLVTMIFLHSDYREFLTDKNHLTYDGEFIDKLKDIIQKKDKKAIVILHMIGSHSGYEHRYPAGFGPFTGLRDDLNKNLPDEYADMLNYYHNSLAYSDIVLSEVIKTIKPLKEPSFFIYFSDHSETIRDGYKPFRNGSSRFTRDYEIPFVVWLSPEYQKLFPAITNAIRDNIHKPFQTDHLIWAMTDLARIRFNGFSDLKNIFSPEYIPEKRYIHDGQIDYEKRKIEEKEQNITF